MKPVDKFNQIKDDYIRVYKVVNNENASVFYEQGFVHLNGNKLRVNGFIKAYEVLISREKNRLVEVNASPDLFTPTITYSENDVKKIAYRAFMVRTDEAEFRAIHQKEPGEVFEIWWNKNKKT